MPLVVFLDFEATSLSSMKDHITQIGAVACNSTNLKEVVSAFQTLVFTKRKIHEKAVKITNITNEKLKGAPKTKLALQSMFDWIAGAMANNDQKEACLVAYNGFGYDFPLLCSELHRWRFKYKEVLEKTGIRWLVDPLKFAKQSVPKSLLHRKNDGSCCYKMDSLHLALYKERIVDAHDAMADAKALAKICAHEKMAEMNVKSKGDGYLKSTDEFCRAFSKKRSAQDGQTSRVVSRKLSILVQSGKANALSRVCDPHRKKSN